MIQGKCSGCEQTTRVQMFKVKAMGDKEPRTLSLCAKCRAFNAYEATITRVLGPGWRLVWTLLLIVLSGCSKSPRLSSVVVESDDGGQREFDLAKCSTTFSALDGGTTVVLFRCPDEASIPPAPPSRSLWSTPGIY